MRSRKQWDMARNDIREINKALDGSVRVNFLVHHTHTSLSSKCSCCSWAYVCLWGYNGQRDLCWTIKLHMHWRWLYPHHHYLPFLVAQVRIPSRLITIVNDIKFLCQKISGSSFNQIILQPTIGESFHEQNSIWCSNFHTYCLKSILLPPWDLTLQSPFSFFPLEIQENLMCNEENLKAIADTE